MAEGVLVVGSGVAGMKAALEVASRGHRVILLEQGAFLGGEIALLERQFPTDRCSLCQMLPTYARPPEGEYCLRHAFNYPGLEVLTSAELLHLEGREGAFRALVRRHPRGVREELCTACGRCLEACPREARDEFDPFSPRKAIYLRESEPVPPVPAIDWGLCDRCGLCLEVCPTGAVDLEGGPQELSFEVSSVILALGFKPFDPRPLTQYGYGRFKNVISSVEFERMLSPLGPSRALRPSDGRPPKRVAFLLCVGSRERRWDFCSAACCMVALKQARLALEALPDLEVVIFGMDLRTFGKGYHRYLLEAEAKGVRFHRGRVPKLWEVPGGKGLLLRSLEGGRVHEEEFDLLVLGVGQRPPKGWPELARALGVEVDRWGFAKTYDGVKTTRPGVYVCGALSGPKDIPDSVTQALAAALEASRGAVPSVHEVREPPPGEEPRVGLLLCRCGGEIRLEDLKGRLEGFSKVWEADYLCLGKGVPELEGVDRLVVGACTPYWFRQRGLRALKGVEPEMIQWVDLRGAFRVHGPEAGEAARWRLLVALERLLREVPRAEGPWAVRGSALVVGGGLAGLEASLALAQEGLEVHLVERQGELGGSLRGRPSMQGVLEGLLERVRHSPRIEIHLRSQVVSFSGQAGDFLAVVQEDGFQRQLQVGAVILATGSEEYSPREFRYGEDPRVITQRELEEGLASGRVRAEGLRSVVMIQCVGSRSPERPWCSRYCCLEALQNALRLKEENPLLELWVLYRDMMSYGLWEELYSRAREAGVVFLRCEDPGGIEAEPSERLLVRVDGSSLEADLLVLSTGEVPRPENPRLAQLFGLELDPDGFFREAEVKFRPVEALREGIYLAGGCHSPRTWDEVILQARAAAQKALGLLKRTELWASGPVSTVKERRCSGCGLCVEACPYGARVLDEELRVARVKGPLCQGCGVCTTLCPNGAAELQGLRGNQVIAALERVL